MPSLNGKVLHLLSCSLPYRTRSVSREDKNLATFLKAPPDKWVESSFEADGPLYMGAMSAHIWSLDKWKQNRVSYLQRLMVMGHARAVAPAGTSR